MPYGTTMEMMVEIARIDDLHEMEAFSLYVQLLHPADILGGRWTTARATEAVASWRLNQMLLEQEEVVRGTTAVWSRDGF